MRRVLISIITIASIAVLSGGCAIFGSNTRDLCDIEEAHVRTFDKSISDCYKLTTKALSRWGAVIFQRSVDDYIVAMEFDKVFRSCINTTEVGIFFAEMGDGKAGVRVTSLNYNLSQFVAEKLFNYIEKDGNVPKEEELKPEEVLSGNPFKQ
jgi:hypothetical protein